MRRHHRILCAGLVIAGVLSAAADAVGQPVYEVLHHFAAPASGAKGKLLAASDGNMYGTTPIGGLHGAGTIFVLRPAASGGFTLETIHAFDGVDGRAPIAGLVEGSDGALYGTAPEGGTAGRGTIFKITTQGIFTLLHTFTGADGAAPQASLILGSDGNLYGTTLQGGTHNLGTVFRLTADDEVMTLHAFAGGDAGAYPVIPVVQGSGGDLFGMTAGRYGSLGGTNQATLFRMTLDGALTTLHVFTYQGMRPALGLTEGLDGSFYGAWVTSPIPVNAGFFRLTPDGAFDVIAEGHSSTVGLPLFGDAPMTRAADGSFYGTFSEAGAHGRGVAFRLTSAGELTVIHAFTPEEGASASGLVEVNGLLYGATIDGGAAGNGMVYSMTKGGVLQRVSQFLGGPAGVPVSAPVLGTDGNLYVTTSQGGSFEEGAVLRMTPDGVVDVLHVFNGADGAHPGASLVLANDGSFHGTTVKGGCHGLGTVFRISASGVFEVVHCFAPGEGAYPSAPLIQARDGNLYGTTVRGGASDAGTIFAVTPSGGFVTAYSFTPPIAFPVGPLLEASDGNYYGTTAGPGPGVGGAVYRFDQTGAQTVLALLQAESPGPIPFTSSRMLGGVSEVGDGTMFAVACCGAHGNVVLRVRSTGGIANSTSLGAAAPANAPIRGLDDHFYGTASGGPSVSFGSLIYRMDAAGAIVEEKMIGHMDGDMAIGALLEVSAGVFYGTTARGGLSGRGVIFRITYP